MATYAKDLMEAVEQTIDEIWRRSPTMSGIAFGLPNEQWLFDVTVSPGSRTFGWLICSTVSD
jgi:hypothetical protein